MVGPSSRTSLPGHPPIRLPRRVSGGSLEFRLYVRKCPVCRCPVQIRITGSSGTAQCRCRRESFRCCLPPLVWRARADTRLTVVTSRDSAPVLEFLRDLDIAPPLLQRMRDMCPLPLPRSSVLPARLSPLMVGLLIQHWRSRTEGRPEPWRVRFLRAGLSARLSALGTRMSRARSALLRKVAEERSLHERFLAHVIVFDPTNLRVCLDPEDLELASCWPMKPGESQEKHRERTRAARAAERVAAYYYSVLFPTSGIVDVALGQIRSAPPSIWSWQDCDLDRNGVPVDVKNVRQVHRRCADAYAEWFAKDKLTDRLSSKVVIAATITKPCGSGSGDAEPTRFESSLIGDMFVRGSRQSRILRRVPWTSFAGCAQRDSSGPGFSASVSTTSVTSVLLSPTATRAAPARSFSGETPTVVVPSGGFAARAAAASGDVTVTTGTGAIGSHLVRGLAWTPGERPSWLGGVHSIACIVHAHAAVRSFGRETFIVRLAEDAMAPRMRVGDYVWVDPDEPAAEGSLAGVRDPWRGGETIVRLLIERDGRRSLRALDDRCPDGTVDADRQRNPHPGCRGARGKHGPSATAGPALCASVKGRPACHRHLTAAAPCGEPGPER